MASWPRIDYHKDLRTQQPSLMRPSIKTWVSTVSEISRSHLCSMWMTCWWWVKMKLSVKRPLKDYCRPYKLWDTKCQPEWLSFAPGQLPTWDSNSTKVKGLCLPPANQSSWGSWLPSPKDRCGNFWERWGIALWERFLSRQSPAGILI